MKLALLLLFFSIAVDAQTPATIPELMSKLNGSPDSARVDLYNHLSFLYMTQDKYDSAVYYSTAAIPICEKLNDAKGLGDAYNNVGTIYRMSGQKEKAMENLLKALAVFEKNNMYRRVAKALGNIAYIYTQQLNFEKAVSTLQQAVPGSEKAKDTLTLIDIYASLAENYAFLKKPSEARAYIDKGELLVQKLAERNFSLSMDSVKFIYARSSLNKVSAVIYNLEGNYKEAAAIFLQELAGSEYANTDELNKFDIFSGLGHSYLQAGKYDSAMYFARQAENMLGKEISPIGFEGIYELKAAIFEKTGKYQDAFFALQRFKYLGDSINSDKATQTLADMRTKYETEKKDNEINELNRQKRSQNIITWLAAGSAVIAISLLLLALRSARLQKKIFIQKEELLIKEKEIETNELQKKMTGLEQMALRAQMNPHFIFNSLNAVQHFVMTRDLEGVNQYLSAFARLVRQTLNNSGRPLITLEEEIKYLDTYLSLEKMKSDNRFTYTIDLAEDINTSHTFIPGMILQPFVENSIRHGIAQKENKEGNIKICFSKNGKLYCSVEDNGIGRQKAAELKSADAADSYESKGMSITMNRIETINKIFESNITVRVDDINTADGNPAGTIVRVEFPTDLE